MFKHIMIYIFLLSLPLYAKTPTASYSSSENIEIINTYILKHYPSVSTENALNIATHIVKKSNEKNQDPLSIATLISMESKFDHKARGRGGAAGLGQLMPGTYKKYDIENPYSITENIQGMVAYMDELSAFWKGKNNIEELTVASYHRGEMFVKRHIKNLGKRTRKYLDRFNTRYEKIKNTDPSKTQK